MELRESRTIRRPREAVWDALLDPAVLERCISGCESVRRLSDTEYRFTARRGVGPVNIRFVVDMHLHDVKRPQSYRMEGKSGGTRSAVQGWAHVGLVEADDGAATEITYQLGLTAQGRLMRAGLSVAQGTMQAMANAFFASLIELVEAPGPTAGLPR